MHYALNDKYPIETIEQIKTASKYFNTHLERFSPAERVKIAESMEKRAEDLGVDIKSDWIHNYSRMTKTGSDYSPDFEYSMGIRRNICHAHNVEVKLGDKMVKVAELFDKMVGNKENVAPLKMVASISELDKLANLEYHYDNEISDPVFTVFGCVNNPQFDTVKLAGGISERDVKKASKDKEFISKIADIFGKNFADEFQRSPVDIFQSMPNPEKQVILEKISAQMSQYKCYKCGNEMKTEDTKGKVTCPKCGATMKKVENKAVEEAV